MAGHSEVETKKIEKMGYTNKTEKIGSTNLFFPSLSLPFSFSVPLSRLLLFLNLPLFTLAPFVRS
jgi:hypothetical protein